MGALGCGGSPVVGSTVLHCWKASDEAESKRAMELCLNRPAPFCASPLWNRDAGAAAAFGLQLAMATSAWHLGCPAC